MSFSAQPSPVQLAVQWLLRDDVFAISALEHLPMELFPLLFKEAFAGRQGPFPCLPMGTLMKTTHMEILKAVLDTLGFLTTQMVRPRELKIRGSHIYTVIEILKILDTDCIKELEVNSWWQQGSLCKLFQSIYKTFFNDGHGLLEMKKCVHEPAPQSFNINCLQHLYMNDIHFLKGNLKKLLRYLKAPLETLSITHCQLSQGDLNHLPLSLGLIQLTHLNLGGVVVSPLGTRPLYILLERAAANLKRLELEGCRMKDSQISSLLPSLSQCTLLTKINFCGNDSSMAILQDLFYHMTNLRQMTMELYAVPWECYDDMGHVLKDRCAQLCLVLMDFLRAIRQPKSVCFASSTCTMLYD
ncbi:PRAME family member 7-like [Acomys russatus]|uniref:PRAME family member 7-like n=1 Tax=Acomys russatus TaxID=60746 RepID=UPI0021E21B01|nr:PRAME family member 7-like [Acomys russatus]